MPKVVLVTGGSSGIGATTAELLHHSGYRVYATSRKAQNGEDHNGITFLNIDLANNTSITSGLQYLLDREDRLDVIINNAGVGFAGPLEHTTTEEITEVFSTNVFGLLELTRQALPVMRKQQSGLIINISSIGGRVALPFRGVYSASKFALEGLSESLSQEVKQFGIKVVIVEPGGFATNITENRKTTVFPSDSPYKEQFGTMYKQVNDDLEKADNPVILAEQLKKIIETDQPALRYAVARFGQKLPLILKPVLPSRYFEKLIMNHFKIKHK